MSSPLVVTCLPHKQIHPHDNDDGEEQVNNSATIYSLPSASLPSVYHQNHSSNKPIRKHSTTPSIPSRSHHHHHDHENHINSTLALHSLWDRLVDCHPDGLLEYLDGASSLGDSLDGEDYSHIDKDDNHHPHNLHGSCGEDGLFESRSSIDSHDYVSMLMSHSPSATDVLTHRLEDHLATKDKSNDGVQPATSSISPLATSFRDTPHYPHIERRPHRSCQNRASTPRSKPSDSSSRSKAAAEKSHASLMDLTSSQTCIPLRATNNMPSSPSKPSLLYHHDASIPDTVNEEEDYDRGSFGLSSTASLPCEILSMNSGSSMLDSASTIQRRVTIRNDPDVIIFNEEDRPRDVCRRITMKRRIRWRLREWRHALVRSLSLDEQDIQPHLLQHDTPLSPSQQDDSLQQWILSKVFSDQQQNESSSSTTGGDQLPHSGYRSALFTNTRGKEHSVLAQSL